MNGQLEGQRKDDDVDAEYEELIPPENFAMVERGLTLVLEDYPLSNNEFNKLNNVTLLQFGVPGNKVVS
ncbi:hypothetical protein DYB37_009624 [Aphanomyces astaci]|uniref:Uncharacterized protein n=1 Tax=Aphanomyces astaci TaxID=112090 RepID=A0A397CXT5_APHAT|nr:hypothetical protein DYB25_010575 [Aphanomyces astaci]RHY42023.1 hypothetical protein DYB34_003849 [Aphanomyces astaci]RHY52033.1 hypothetical protein DYB30_006501 [Aphanomyces astaci]RHY63804.1 hypothetical protein DYB38_005816 [Aphanomyces astaci]RHZ10570.1 hypothetical protein DYB37_009624 [Aphanomyces astaci]